MLREGLRRRLERSPSRSLDGSAVGGCERTVRPLEGDRFQTTSATTRQPEEEETEAEPHPDDGPTADGTLCPAAEAGGPF